MTQLLEMDSGGWLDVTDPARPGAVRRASLHLAGSLRNGRGRLRLLMDEDAIQKLAIGSYRPVPSAPWSKLLVRGFYRDSLRSLSKGCRLCIRSFDQSSSAAGLGRGTSVGRFQWPIMVPAVMPKYNASALVPMIVRHAQHQAMSSVQYSAT